MPRAPSLALLASPVEESVMLRDETVSVERRHRRSGPRLGRAHNWRSSTNCTTWSSVVRTGCVGEVKPRSREAGRQRRRAW